MLVPNDYIYNFFLRRSNMIWDQNDPNETHGQLCLPLTQAAPGRQTESSSAEIELIPEANESF